MVDAIPFNPAHAGKAIAYPPFTVTIRLAVQRKSSYAGLTRVSINLHENLSKKMDGRVKPGHDG
jgi:hypothetical protein